MSYESRAELIVLKIVFVALNPETPDWVVIKRETESSAINHEEEVIKSLGNIPGFPRHELSINLSSDDHHYVVMNYMGCDLQRLFYHFPSIFAPTNTARISVWMVSRMI